jgi:hypothetical protein
VGDHGAMYSFYILGRLSCHQGTRGRDAFLECACADPGDGLPAPMNVAFTKDVDRFVMLPIHAHLTSSVQLLIQALCHGEAHGCATSLHAATRHPIY